MPVKKLMHSCESFDLIANWVSQRKTIGMRFDFAQERISDTNHSANLGSIFAPKEC